MPDTHHPAPPVWTPEPPAAKARGLCTDCGLSRGPRAAACGRACQFIRPDYPAAETRVHGRVAGDGDEAFFGVIRAMHRARLTPPAPGAQWTGITTALAARALETGAVDAVLTMVPDPADRWKPLPAIITEADAMAEARGMRMGYAPLLSLLEPAREAGHRRIAVIGIPCQVYALRAIEAELEFESVTVIGTPCSDNTTTENFHAFLARLTDRPEDVSYLEFRADYHVEMRFDDGHVREIPFLKLPLADLPRDFFPVTCRTCVDYTNRLADVTVGYMGGTGAQWVIARNDRGLGLIEAMGAALDLSAPETGGKRESSVRGFIENTKLAAGGLPLRRMPDWLRGVMAWVMPRFGPKGLEFARTRVEMKAAETVLHLRREHPKRMKWMVPEHVWRLVERYGIGPEDGERR